MNRPPASPPIFEWTLVWLAGVIGGPSLGFWLVTLVGDRSPAATPCVFLPVIAGLILHIVATAKIATHVSSTRLEAYQGTGCLFTGLLIGGWAVMLAILMEGCFGH